jgi:small subunit ribosomal protein S15
MPSKTEIKAKKSEIVKKFGTTASDTGTPEVQVALITHRISELNGHFKTHKMDFASKRGLLKLVGQRRRLLAYLKNNYQERYLKLIKSLELRK